MKTAKRKTKKLQQDSIESIINKAVDDALERLDIDVLIRDAIEELNIPRIVRRTIYEAFAEMRAG